jgi:hypothetical protein
MWEIVEVADERHILPRYDIKRHQANPKCACGPKREYQGTVVVVIHNSYDGREFREQGEAHAAQGGRN